MHAGAWNIPDQQASYQRNGALKSTPVRPHFDHPPMKRTLLTILALIAATLNAADFPKGSPQFATSADAALKAAKDNGKPAILVFSASWCGPCQEMKKDVYPSASVKPFHDKFNWAYLDIDVEANGKLFGSYKLDGVPSIMFVDSEGKKVDFQEGATSPEEFTKKLQNVLAKTGQQP